MTREITILDHKAMITLGTERRKIRPWGLMGGKPGGGSDCWIISPGEQKQALPSKVTTQVEPGTRIALRTAGGGGFGDPLERDPQKVQNDVEEDLISVDRAKDEYGVVINTTTNKIDNEATALLRKQFTSEVDE